MIRSCLAAALAIALSSCAAAPRSRWETSERGYMVCRCDGTERPPTPGEAASFREDERVDLFCEGKVSDCHPGALQMPMPRHYTGPYNPNTLD